MTRFSTPRGTYDILPEEWPWWMYVFDRAREAAESHGYSRVETPIFADTGLFARSSGEGSDVVDKEMYTFRDREGASLSLRPEGTAPVMRMYLQHGMAKRPQPVKLYYFERMYRYSRPQRGRFHEHRQFGCEALGSDDPYVDVEMIALLHDFYRRCGLTNLSLHLNSIGDKNCRPAYVARLVAYLAERAEALAPVDRERLARNPLRVLDSKEKDTRAVLSDVPNMLDYLCAECKTHWDRVRHGLDELGIRYELDLHLVRGLDYYTRTVFEFLSPYEGAQSAVSGGGRYDALAESIGGPHVPGIGFGCGLDRLILTMKDQGMPAPPVAPPLVYVVHMGSPADDRALQLTESLRSVGIRAEMAFGSRSLNAQMKRANSTGARYVAIIGQDEVTHGAAQLRDLRSGEQRPVALTEIADALLSAE